jgi:type IV pilus assembly protein PilC
MTESTDIDGVSAKQRRLALFWKKYMRLTRGGVLALRALEIIAAEEPDSDFAGVVDRVRIRIEGGSSVSESLAAIPEEFSLSQVEMIKAAENLGTWDEALAELAEGLAEGTFG